MLDDLLASARTTQVVTLPPGVYERDLTLHVPEGVRVVAHGVTLKMRSDGSDVPTPAGEKNRATFLRGRKHVDLADGAHWHGGRVEGVNGSSDYRRDREAQHGVTCRGNNVVEGVEISGVFGDGLYAAGDDVAVRDLTIDGTGRQGVGMANGRRLLVEGFTIDRVARSVFDLEPAGKVGEQVHDVTIRHGTVGTWGLGFSNNRGGAVLAAGGTGVVSDVTLEDVSTDGVFLVNVEGPARDDGQALRERFTIRRCTGQTRHNRQTLSFTRCDDILVCGHDQLYGSPKRGPHIPAVKLDDCTGFWEYGNRFEGATATVESH